MLRRIELQERSDVLEGQAFGAAGPYERIVGRAHFAVDPKLAPNRRICDIHLAPRNDQGEVEFSADLCVLKPRDPARGNGTAVFDVANRGVKLLTWIFNRAEFSFDPRTAAQFGDNFLLRQGFTIVWVGWEFDVPEQPNRLRLYAPVATDGGRAIRGTVRSEFVTDAKVLSFSLGDNGQIPYTVSDPDDPNLRLTVRDGGEAMRRTIPRDRWQLAREEKGRAVPDRGSVFMADGFEPGKIYELLYTAQNPVVAGLGFAATRDLASFLKFGGPRDGITLLGDQQHHLKHTILFGASQSGRFVRTFLYEGFNQDEKGRRAFDGAWAHIAGAGQGSFNHRFAQPSRGADPHVNFFYPTFPDPFTDREQPDSQIGITEGLLTRAREANVAPKVFYTNTSYEYWAFAASLTHTSLDGTRDVVPPVDTRIYMFSGAQHVPGPFPPRRGGTRYLINANDHHWSLRALLIALNRWITDGAAPPASQYPQLGEKTLVPCSAVAFPKLPEVELPGYVYTPHLLDFGPSFRKTGIITIEPPKVGAALPALVPQVDSDGNETAGIRMPELQAPLATYTGWNLRDAAIGAPGTLAGNSGSMFPFSRTAAERESRAEPRPSIEERYRDSQQYLDRVRAGVRKLVAGGYLLSEDEPKLVEQARIRWEWFTKSANSG